MGEMTFQEWPEDLPRNIDFIPSLLLQEKLNPRMEVCHMVASTSKLDAAKTQAPKRASSLKLKRVRKTTTHVYFQYGEPDFHNPGGIDVTSIPELKQSLYDDAGFEDATIAQRIVIHDIPKPIEHLLPFQGYDQIFEAQAGSSSRSRQLQKLLGLHTWNPRRSMSANLLKEKYITSMKDGSLKKLQSNLVTDWLKPSDPSLGVFHFGDKLQLLETELVKDTPSKERWWLDTGIPQSLSARLGGLSIDVRLFSLIKHNEPVAVSVSSRI
jgi:hypothetical protein